MTTTVVNTRNDDCDVYVGRPSLFGNPIRIGLPCSECDQVHRRSGTIDCFTRYFCRRVDTEPAFKAAVLALRNKILGCWCVPKPCHAEIIARYVNNYYGEKS